MSAIYERILQPLSDKSFTNGHALRNIENKRTLRESQKELIQMQEEAFKKEKK